MILVTGPTGSGKTTTLYAALRHLNKASDKLISIEDPIEYQIDGITQIQVKPEIELDFARVLRSVVRHDPDVIMVGETRDPETADIAVHAALTGHLLLTTLHTNSAAGAVARLLDMGVEPYLLASVLRGILGQRLVGILCPACKTGRPATPDEAAFFTQAGLEVPAEPAALRGAGLRGLRGYGLRRPGRHLRVPGDERADARADPGPRLDPGGGAGGGPERACAPCTSTACSSAWPASTTLEEVCSVTSEDW